MKRRKAIGRILIASGATAAAYGGYEWFELTKKPELSYLLSKTSLLAELAETLIPETDTPGAKEAGVMDFMMPLLTECTDTKTLNRFIEGLRDLEAHTHSRYQKDFLQCTAQERDQILRYIEDRSQPVNETLGRAKSKVLGRSFFETLRQYTVESYCISEKGASQALRYIPVPGRYQGCLPMETDQKAWATN
ncbi:MAG: gluconate 2-dehydrogenase subunit 3 family protein [Bacteroidota bacterium]|nr:gluconate 2-dehydrogenase subunit 3 family protein [Bacteroidota bacterium]